MSFLTLTDLRKVYDDGTEAVKSVNVSIEEGEFVVLLGPSGCGKTTTLRMIAGLEEATSGTVELGGKNVTKLRPGQRDVGFVFQFYALYPHLSVHDNIDFPLRSSGVSKTQRRDQVQRVAERLGLQHLMKRYPGQLSGGDQQRISLARAMVRKPQIYLMDEPLGTLDADVRLEMREFIREQQLELKVTTIYVTHDQEEAMSLADRIVVMKDGLIRQVGTPLEVYDRPADAFVADFVGSPGMNFLKGEIKDGAFVSNAVRLPVPGTCDAGPATFGVRPEYLQPDEKGSLRGKVATVEFFGSCQFVYVDTPCGRLVMRREIGTPISVGDELAITPEAEHVCVFAGDNKRLVG